MTADRKHPLKDDHTGILAGPLIFSVFVGLLLVVVFYPVLIKLDFSARLRHGVEGSIFIAVLLLSVLAYQSAKAIKFRKFVKGAQTPLLLRELKNGCLQGDIRSLEILLAEHEDSDFHILLTLLQAKAENILQTDIAHLSDIHKRVGLRIFTKKGPQSFHLLFRHPDAYARSALPREIVLLRKAAEKGWPVAMQRRLNALESARRSLFTLFHDYLDIVPEQNTHLPFLRKTYKYQVPAPEIARKITYCLDVFDCVDRLKEADTNTPLRDHIDMEARRRIPELRKGIARYRAAWEEMVVTYEAVLKR